jgi:hypothetical protein
MDSLKVLDPERPIREADIARELERCGLVEIHTDPLILTPNDMTGNVSAVRLKDEVETLGDVMRLDNIERRPRNSHVAYQAINYASSELNRSRHQHRLARDRASFHETLMC